jgi:hypothetical protein
MSEDRTVSGPTEFRIDFGELDLGPPQVAAAMGYPDAEAARPYDEMIRTALGEAGAHAEVRAGFRLFPPGTLILEERAFRLAGVRFDSRAIVAHSLRGSTGLAIFAVTAGRTYDDWIRAHFDRNDLVGGFLIDAIGSEIAEAAADRVEARIREAAAELGLSCTNRFSPGYCGWSVAEQPALFGFLPERFLGITLTSTSLMIPMKSVSGVVGLGADVTRADYPCRACSVEDCYRRRAEFER